MAIPIKVPSVGESITEGVIARWLKRDGEAVKADEPVFELETEKASSEIPAPTAGVLRIKSKEGETVSIGAVVGEIDPDGKPSKAETKPEKEKPKEKEPKKEEPTKEEPAKDPKPRKAEERPPPAQEDKKPAKPREPEAAAKQREQASEKRAPAPPTAPGERETRERLSAIRQRIAERLLSSQQQTASLTTFNEVDLSAIVELRQRYKDKFKEEYGVGLGFMSFFVKACVQALKAFPLVNARIDGSDVVYPNYWNIGIAVSTEKGLMVPVLRDADRMSFMDIERAIIEMANKARDGKISVTDLQGGTFTITNGGVFGSLLSTPILNPPQSAILGMHTIQKRPVVRDDQIVIRPMMYVALTYDHRLIDGREAVLFLVRVKEFLEQPERMLLEV